jgi:hypothetical protein
VWEYSKEAQTLTLAASNGKLCLDSGGGPPACSAASPSASLPFCNVSLPLAARVEDLVSRISMEEAWGMFQNGASGDSSLALQPYQWWSEALHGIANAPGNTFQAPTPFATSFPQVILTSASFNRSLYHAIGAAIGLEGRAMNNVGNAGLTFWAPNINIFRDPRWGRGQGEGGAVPE